MDSCHALSAGIKRQLHDTRKRLIQCIQVNAAFLGNNAKTRLRRVAQHRVAFFSLLRGKQFGVRTQRSATEQKP